MVTRANPSADEKVSVARNPRASYDYHILETIALGDEPGTADGSN